MIFFAYRDINAPPLMIHRVGLHSSSKRLIEWRTFHTTGGLRFINPATIEAARLPWYIHPCRRSGRHDAATRWNCRKPSALDALYPSRSE